MKEILEKKIVIVGSGQLGSRHLQALALLENPAQIYVVDPIPEALIVAKERFEQIKTSKRHALILCQSIFDIEIKSFDLVIIATNSSVRSQVVKELVMLFNFKNIILEKFLFQTVNDYHDIGNLFIQNQINAFVNCPRRLNPSYAKLKSLLHGYEDLTIQVIGNNWGLGSNAIHFIDLYQWFTGNDISAYRNSLEKGFCESKRFGYIDFFGTLEGLAHDRSCIRLTSLNSKSQSLKIIFEVGNRKIVVDELKNTIVEVFDNGTQISMDLKFETLYQSNLTNLVAEQIFNYGSCDLTQYSESVRIHLPLFEALLAHYNQNKRLKSLKLPIT